MAVLKLKAATLIESLMAMIIIMLCLGIATMIYVNIMNADNNSLKLKAQLVLAEQAYQAKSSNTFLDDNTETETLLIEKKIEKYKQQDNLILLYLKAFDKNTKKLLAERKELIVVH